MPPEHHDPEEVDYLVLHQAGIVESEGCEGNFKVLNVELFGYLPKVHMLNCLAKSKWSMLHHAAREAAITGVFDLVNVKLLDCFVSAFSQLFEFKQWLLDLV